MELFFNEIWHFLVTGIIAYLLYKYVFKRKLTIFFTFVGGIFIDSDHFIDLFLYKPFFVDGGLLTSGDYFKEKGTLYLFFHAWEYIVIGILLFFLIKGNKKYYILAISLGMFGHLLTDVFTNGTSFELYSIIYRYINDFSYEILATKNH